jgi:hypothetical protein
LVSFGTQNLQEYNMANFSSLLASIKGGTSVGAKKGSTGIDIKAGQDLSVLNKLLSSLGDVEGELGKEFVEMETARGKGQLAGGTAAGITAFILSGGNPLITALATGGGSYAGGHYATRKDVSDIMRQKREKERLLENRKNTLFHSSKEERAEKYGKDLDRYISSANTQLKDRLIKNSLLDAAGSYLMAGKFKKWDPKGTGASLGDFMKTTGPEGDPLGVTGGIKAYSKAAKSKAMTDAGLNVGGSALGLADISVDPSISNKYMGSGSFFDITGGPISGRGTGRGAISSAMTLADIVGYDPSKHILPTPRRKLPPFSSILNEEENLLSNIFSGQGIIQR